MAYTAEIVAAGTESDSLVSWLNSASVSSLQVMETTMEHHNRFPE